MRTVGLGVAHGIVGGKKMNFVIRVILYFSRLYFISLGLAYRTRVLGVVDDELRIF